MWKLLCDPKIYMFPSKRCPVLQSYIQLMTGKRWALCVIVMMITRLLFKANSSRVQRHHFGLGYVCMLDYAIFVSCGAPNSTKGRC